MPSRRVILQASKQSDVLLTFHNLKDGRQRLIIEDCGGLRLPGQARLTGRLQDIACHVR